MGPIDGLIYSQIIKIIPRVKSGIMTIIKVYSQRIVAGFLDALDNDIAFPDLELGLV